MGPTWNPGAPPARSLTSVGGWAGGAGWTPHPPACDLETAPTPHPPPSQGLRFSLTSAMAVLMAFPLWFLRRVTSGSAGTGPHFPLGLCPPCAGCLLPSPGFGFESELRLQWPGGCPTLPLPRFPCLHARVPGPDPQPAGTGATIPCLHTQRRPPGSLPGGQGAQKPAVLVGSLETARGQGFPGSSEDEAVCSGGGGEQERQGRAEGRAGGEWSQLKPQEGRGVKRTPEAAAGPLDSESVPGCRRLLRGPDLRTEPLAPITIPKATVWSSGSHHGAKLGRKVTNSPVGRGDRAGSFRGSLHICILALTPPRSQNCAPSPRPN